MPAVTRIGDKDLCHCTPGARAQGSSNVFANGKGISRQGDLSTTHYLDRNTTHTAAITTGSNTVFVNGKGCGRIGDEISGCTAVAQGSPNVFAGN